MILAFDPGVCTGWAAASTQADRYGTLIACGVIEWDGFSFVMSLPGTEAVIDVLVVEKPQVYRSGLQKGDPEGLIDTAVRAGRLADRAFMLFAHAPGYRELFPTPHDWKGSTPKDIHNKRVLAALTSEERALIPKLPKTKLHNAIDASALAKWASREVGR